MTKTQTPPLPPPTKIRGKLSIPSMCVFAKPDILRMDVPLSK